jgi:hypothetical protein
MYEDRAYREVLKPRTLVIQRQHDNHFATDTPEEDIGSSTDDHRPITKPIR